MNYKMVKADDGIVWVTLQPLLSDVKQALENAKNIDTSKMDNDEKQGVNFTILAMESVHNFITSLLTEHSVREMVESEEKKNNTQETLH
jgi:hypothetical protein